MNVPEQGWYRPVASSIGPVLAQYWPHYGMFNNVIDTDHLCIQENANYKLGAVCLNIKMLHLTQYRVLSIDKMVSQPYYLYNENPFTWKDSLYIETWPWFS